MVSMPITGPDPGGAASERATAGETTPPSLPRHPQPLSVCACSAPAGQILPCPSHPRRPSPENTARTCPAPPDAAACLRGLTSSSDRPAPQLGDVLLAHSPVAGLIKRAPSPNASAGARLLRPQRPAAPSSTRLALPQRGHEATFVVACSVAVVPRATAAARKCPTSQLQPGGPNLGPWPRPPPDPPSDHVAACHHQRTFLKERPSNHNHARNPPSSHAVVPSSLPSRPSNLPPPPHTCYCSLV
jgi:hypothetical protein